MDKIERLFDEMYRNAKGNALSTNLSSAGRFALYIIEKFI